MRCFLSYLYAVQALIYSTAGPGSSSGIDIFHQIRRSYPPLCLPRRAADEMGDVSKDLTVEGHAMRIDNTHTGPGADINQAMK